MKSENILLLLKLEFENPELTPDEFVDTVIHFAKTYHEEELKKIKPTFWDFADEHFDYKKPEEFYSFDDGKRWDVYDVEKRYYEVYGKNMDNKNKLLFF